MYLIAIPGPDGKVLHVVHCFARRKPRVWRRLPPGRQKFQKTRGWLRLQTVHDSRILDPKPGVPPGALTRGDDSHDQITVFIKHRYLYFCCYKSISLDLLMRDIHNNYYITIRRIAILFLHYTIGRSIIESIRQQSRPTTGF